MAGSRSLNGLGLGLALIASAAPAHSNSLVLEEVVVTAQKRPQNLMDVPVSVSSLNGDQMQAMSLNNMDAISAYVPNLTMNQTGIGTVLAIRGISSGINQGFEQSVGQYMDGVYYGRAHLVRGPMVDMDRIEVLRGPQSILFGKNSIAGAVSMHTAKPTDEFEGKISVLYETEHDERDVRAVLSGPLTESLTARLALLDREMDGYYDNTTLGRDESGDDEQMVRLTLQWMINDDTTATLKVEDGSFDTEGRNLEIVNPAGAPYAGVLALLTGGAYVQDTAQNYRRQSGGDSSNTDTENITLTLEHEAGDFTFTSISAYNAYDMSELCDCDFVGAPVFDASQAEDYEQFSQEFRIASPAGDTIEYIAGVYYQTSELEYRDSLNLPANSVLIPALTPLLGFAPSFALGSSSKRLFQQDSDLWSAFAQVTWNISDDTRLTVGARYTDEQKDASRKQTHVAPGGIELPAGSPADPFNIVYGLIRFEPYDTVKRSRSETALTPLVTLQHDFNEDVMAYATYTTGFKSGGFDARSNAHPDPAVFNALYAGVVDIVGVFEFEEEEAESIELGAKFTLAGGAAELNAALFRTEYTDLQTSQYDGSVGFNVTNAAEATSQGLELDGRWRVTSGLTLNGSLALLDFEYDEFPNAECYFGQVPDSAGYPGLCDAGGKEREYTPDVQATLGLNYAAALNNGLQWQAGIDVIYSDDYFATPTLDPNLHQDAFVKVNARLSLMSADDQWEVALIGKNLTDEEVMTFGNKAPLATTLTGGAGAFYYAFYDRPRTLALQGIWRF